MPIPWTSALRIYAKEMGRYIVPKKGSEAYEIVKAIQQETEMSDEHKVKRKPRTSTKAAGVKEDLPPAHVDPSVVKGKVSRKKAPTPGGAAEESLTREGDDVLPTKAHTTAIDDSRRGKKTKIVDPDDFPEQESKKGLSRTGKTVKADAQNFIENKNTGIGAVVTAQLAGQKQEIEKALKQAKKTPKVVNVGSGDKEATIDGMKTDDPAAIEGNAPFSILALRKKLLA